MSGESRFVGEFCCWRGPGLKPGGMRSILVCGLEVEPDGAVGPLCAVAPGLEVAFAYAKAVAPG